MITLIGICLSAFIPPDPIPHFVRSQPLGPGSLHIIQDSGFVINECGFPLAQYDFDRGYGTTAADQSFGSNAGTLNNGPKWVPGMLGNALDFDGTDDYIDIAHTADLDLVGSKDAFTLMAWIQPRTFQDGDGIITLGVSQSPVSLQIWDGDGDPTDGFARITINAGMSGSASYQSTIKLDIDTWHHVCVTYDGQQFTFIVDGVRDAYAPLAASDIAVVNQSLRIGADFQGSNDFFDGLIDEVRIYCMALPLSTVQSLYQSGVESCQIPVLVNGDFESGTYTLNGSFLEEYSSGSTLGGSWQVFGGNDVTLHRYDHVPSGQTAFIGQGIYLENGSLYHVDLGSYPGSGSSQGIRQTITGLMPGQTYRLSFRYAKHTTSTLDTAAIRVKIGGGNTLNTTLKAVNPGDGQWLKASYFFSPTSSSEDIVFKAAKVSGAPVCCGFLLDDCHICEIDKVPFPVEWLSFTGQQVQDYIDLEWVTASEENNHYFELERSTDGLAYQRIHQLGAVGQSSQARAYQYRDASPHIGTNHYRIKQVDLDGVFSYSEVQSIDYHPEQVSMRMYPNPIGKQAALALAFTIPTAQVLHVQLFNTAGTAIWQDNMQVQQGYAAYQIPTHHMVSGVYMLRIKGPKTSLTRRVIIQ